MGIAAITLSGFLPVQLTRAQYPVPADGTSFQSGSYASSVPLAVSQDDAYFGPPADQLTSNIVPAPAGTSAAIYNYLSIDANFTNPSTRVPIPTNHWWTDLMMPEMGHPDSGNEWRVLPRNFRDLVLSPTETLGEHVSQLWLTPGRVDPRNCGLDLYYPNAWQPANTNVPQNTKAAIAPGAALQIRGDRGFVVPPGDILVGDFESSFANSGWTVDPSVPNTAFPNLAPAQSNWTDQSPLPRGMMGKGYINTEMATSTQSGDNYTGAIYKDITVQKHYINLRVAGGHLPDKDAVQLIVNGQIVAYAIGQDSGDLRWTTWDVSHYMGQKVRIRIVDSSTGDAWGFIACDEIVQSDTAVQGTEEPNSLEVPHYDPAFRVDGEAVTNWGDWNVDFRLTDSLNQNELDVTAARGIPFTWTVWKNGLLPKIMVPAGTALTNLSGGTISTAGGTFVASAFAFTYPGSDPAQVYGVFLPDNTTVNVNGDGSLEPQLAGTNNYMVVGFLPDASVGTLNDFNNVAFARPIDTKMTWDYSNPESGYVRTNWTVTTQPLKGGNTNTIQGWLPHHYDTTKGLPQFNNYSYTTSRGLMRTTTGNQFTISFPFNGIVPTLPAPQADPGDANPYNYNRMLTYLQAWEPGAMIGDTYWSGKRLALCAQYMAWAYQIGDAADGDRLKKALEDALDDWFTYTPGEETTLKPVDNQYPRPAFFAKYPEWGAFIGTGASYGSQSFNDLHFHYGYFTTAASTLAMYDPAFVAKYKPMLTLIAKSYANYDRYDQSEPFLRMFDVWEGHSNAGGTSGATGENQESSSEAMQGWAGLFLLGGMTNDSAMMQAGAMGFAVEGAATQEYWEDVYQKNFPSVYHRAYSGQAWADSYAYGTFFSGDPAWVYAIQWGPSNHWLNYLTRGTGVLDTVKAKYNSMWQERALWPSYGAYSKDTGANVYWDNSTQYKNGAWVSYKGVLYSAQTSHQEGGETVKDPTPAGHAAPDTNRVDWGIVADCTVNEPSILGDSPGHVVHAFQALLDPDAAAEEFDRYYNAGLDFMQPYRPNGDFNDIQAGSTYYLIHSMRQAGQQDFTATTNAPVSSVYVNPKTGKTSYLIFNPSSTQQSYTVYRNGVPVGSPIAVPAQSFVDSHMDSTLARLVVASTPAKVLTVQPGQNVQFAATAYDQYNAGFVEKSGVTWSVNQGGSIDANGLFTASTDADPVIVTATYGNLPAATYQFRVEPAPVLSRIDIDPGVGRIITGNTQQYSAIGRDQYGDQYSLGTVTWSSVGSAGSIDATSGLFTSRAQGTVYLTATSGGVSATELAIVHNAPTINLARSIAPQVSSTNGTNVATNMTDGDPNTRWESVQHVDPQWVYVDLGKVYDLSSVVVTWERAYATAFDVKVATDLTQPNPWRSVTSVTNPKGLPDKSVNTVPLTNAVGRYVALGLSSRAIDFGYSIYELQVYGFLSAASITPASLQISPANVGALINQPVPFTAYAFDANGEGGPVTGAAWTVTGGAVDASGNFSAATAGGPYTVTAALGNVAGTTNVTVTNPPTATLTNVALHQAAFASSSQNDGTAAYRVTDGDTGSRWSSAATDDESITVDLGVPVPLSQVILNWENAYGAQYLIQGSNDGTTWTNPPLYKQMAGKGGVETIPVSGTYRYVRMQGVQRATPYGYSLWEMQVMSYYPPHRTDLALHMVPTASSTENAGTAASNATDGDLTSRWSSAATDDESITVDLGAPKALSQVQLHWEAAYGVHYLIEGSNDGNVWATLKEQTNGQGGTETWDVSGTYQKIRMHGFKRGTAYGYSLWEMQIY